MARRPRDLASRMASRRTPNEGFKDGFVRQTFTLPREKARDRARDFLDRYPKAGLYERRRELARIAGRRHRIHYAQARKCRLAFDARSPGTISIVSGRFDGGPMEDAPATARRGLGFGLATPKDWGLSWGSLTRCQSPLGTSANIRELFCGPENPDYVLKLHGLG